MQLIKEDLARVSIDSHAVIEQAKAASVYVFAGGINRSVNPVLVAANGLVTPDIHPRSNLADGFTVLELPTRQDAEEWARKIAIVCRCSQELRQFMYDPATLCPFAGPATTHQPC